jgi:VWFA-related protein
VRIATLILLASTALVDAQQVRVSVQVAVVDVTVVDSRGTPIEGLGPTDFTVTVDGQPSPVVTLEYLRVDRPRSTSGNGTGETERDARSPGGRSVVFVLDDLSFKPQPPRALGISVDRLVRMLGQQDRVGLTTTSGLGPTIAPTTERPALQDVLSRLTGRRDDTAAPFYVGIDEALALQSRQGATNLVKRECALLGRGGGCGAQVLSATRREAILAVRRTEEQIQSLRETIEWMQALPEPRVLILLSAGIAADPRHNLREQVRALSDAAANAAVQLYALTDVADVADVSDLTLERAQARRAEARFLNRGVQTFAAAAGGEAFLVVGEPDRFLQRILLETSATYRLGVRINQASTDATKFLDMRVKVNRRGATTRARHRAMRPGAS